MRKEAEDRCHPGPRITGGFAQHSPSLSSSSSSSSPSPFFLLPVSPFLTKFPLSTYYLRDTVRVLWGVGFVGPGTCFEISEVHLLSFPDELFPNYPVTQFPSLLPGCPKSLFIPPHPGLSLWEVPLVSELPLAHVCLLPYRNRCLLRTSQMDAWGLN